MPPSDEGGAPKGRRERKSGSFCRKIFGFSGFSNLARQSRSPAEPSKTRPISPSAAPPQLPRQEALRPGRARNAPGLVRSAGLCCWDGHGPSPAGCGGTIPVHSIQVGRCCRNTGMYAPGVWRNGRGYIRLAGLSAKSEIFHVAGCFAACFFVRINGGLLLKNISIFP